MENEEWPNPFKWLDSEEFYNICQYYRHVPISNPAEVLLAYKNLQGYIQTKVEKMFEGM